MKTVTRKPTYEQVMAAVHRLCRAERAVERAHDRSGVTVEFMQACQTSIMHLAAVDDLVRRATGGGL